jgi:hypothetical protein
MNHQLKICFSISAAVSITAIFILFGDELARRLGNYFITYSVIWGLFLIGLILISFRVKNQPSKLKTVILAVGIGYLSVVLAFVFAVVLDVFGIRQIHQPINIDTFVIPLIFPFFALKGWIFSALFTTLIFLLARVADNQWNQTDQVRNKK